MTPKRDLSAGEVAQYDWDDQEAEPLGFVAWCGYMVLACGVFAVYTVAGMFKRKERGHAGTGN